MKCYFLSASMVGTEQLYRGNGAAVCRSPSQEDDGIAGAKVMHQLAQDVEHLISGFTDAHSIGHNAANIQEGIFLQYYL